MATWNHKHLWESLFLYRFFGDLALLMQRVEVVQLPVSLVEDYLEGGWGVPLCDHEDTKSGREDDDGKIMKGNVLLSFFLA